MQQCMAVGVGVVSGVGVGVRPPVGGQHVVYVSVVVAVGVAVGVGVGVRPVGGQCKRR